MRKFLNSFACIITFLVFSNAQAQTWQDAMKMLDMEQYTNAGKNFEAVATKDPTPENLYYLGYYHLKMYPVDSNETHIATAKSKFQEGITKDPKFPLNYVGLGAVAMQEMNKDEAHKNFDKAIAMTKYKDPDVLYRVGEAYLMFDYKEPDQAAIVLEKALEKHAKRGDIHLMTGDAYQVLGNSGKANGHYDQAILLNPQSARAYIQSGKILVRAKNYQEALNLYKKGIAADPNYAPGYRELGELYYAAGQYSEAVANYKKYTGMADTSPEARYKYAAFLFLNKDYATALDELNKLKGELNYPAMYRLLGYSHYELGNFDKGVEELETFFKKSPKEKILSSDYEYLGRLQLKAGKDTAQAISNLVKVAQQDTAKVGIWEDLGKMYLDKKDYTKAAQYLSDYLKNSKNASAGSYVRLGQSYYFAKDYTKSDSVFATLNTVKPDYAYGFYWKARTTGKVSDPESYASVPAYEKLVELVLAQNASDDYKKELVEAYAYLGSYQLNKMNDRAKAESLWNEGLKIDPANKAINDRLTELRSGQ